MTLFTEYAKIRELHPDAIPLLRVGDFYETYGEGADTLARVLGLALTTAPAVAWRAFPASTWSNTLPGWLRPVCALPWRTPLPVTTTM